MGEDLTTKQLKFAQWYLSHKTEIYKIFLGLLVAVNLALWGLVSYNFINYFLQTDVHEEMLAELTRNKIDYLKFHERFKPLDLTIAKSVFLSSAVSGQTGKFNYDFVAVIENPNGEWLIPSVEYYFSWDGGETEVKRSFILPGEKKNLAVLGQKTDKKLNEVNFVFSKIKWQRISSKKERLEILSKLSVKDINLEYAIAEDKMVAIPKISFKIKNLSIHGLWQADFTVILYQGSNIVGINTLSAKQWLSNEERKMELMWPNIPQHSRIAVVPEVNPFNPDIFMSVY